VLVATVVTFLRIYREEYVDPQPVPVANVPSGP
jgi:hypothetical protein